jgi:sortase B
MNKKRLGTIAVILGFSLVIGACVFSIAGKVVTEKAEDDEFKKISHSVSADSTVTTKETQTKTDSTSAPSAVTVPEGTQQPSHSTEELLAMNNECYAWISIKDTRISYPVMHTPNDPDKYLNRNFYGQYSSSGVPYMDARCTDDSDNKIIFGHHMNFGSMFSDLCKYTSRMFRDTHQDVLLETRTDREIYKIFAVLQIKANDYWYNFITAETEKKYDKKIEYALKHTLYKTRIVPKFRQKLLTLSTCMGTERDDRLLVIAVKQ